VIQPQVPLRLAGNVGLTIFRAIANLLNIPEMEGYETKIRHLPLLKLMAFPVAVIFGEKGAQSQES